MADPGFSIRYEYNVSGGGVAYAGLGTGGLFVWGSGDTIVIKNTGTRTGNVTFTRLSLSTEDTTDNDFTLTLAVTALPAPGAETRITSPAPTAGFGNAVLTANTRMRRQTITILGTLSAQTDGAVVTASVVVPIQPKLWQDTCYRQNGITGQVSVYSDYWQLVQPVAGVTALTLSNTGKVPLIYAIKNSVPTDFTRVGLRLAPGEFRLITPPAAGYLVWARVEDTGPTLNTVGVINYSQF